MQANAVRPLRVAIIGAGIGGLAAACALLRRGFEVQVYERAPALGEVGAGVQIGPNAFKVLRALGFEDELRRNAFEPTNQIRLNWDDAALRSRRPMKGQHDVEFGAPYLTAHRADLHRILRAPIPDTSIHLAKHCTGAASSNGTAVASFADGSEIEADLIVGADGIRSAIREQLFGADQPRFTNSICWRALVPIEYVPSRVGPGGSVAIERSDYFAWYGPNGQVICYPIGDGSMLNIFAGRISREWTEESWSLPSSRQELLAAYQGWNEALLGIFAKVEQCFKWGIFDRDPRTQWTRGRVTLLGDAAHPTMPNLAQGANMAIEDGYVLARNLAHHGRDIDTALARYVAERQPRTSEITLQSRENFERTLQVPPAPPVDRSWIYSFDATLEPA